MATNSPTLKKNQFMRAMHKIAVDVTFTQIIAKKGLKINIKSEIAAMYKEYN